MQENKLEEIRKEWFNLGVDNFIYEKNDKIYLSQIVIPKNQRNKGLGTKLMKQLINFADTKQKKIVLTPSIDYGATSRKRLIDFYKRFGFIENKGKNRDFKISEYMYRIPKMNKNLNGINIINYDDIKKSIKRQKNFYESAIPQLSDYDLMKSVMSARAREIETEPPEFQEFPMGTYAVDEYDEVSQLRKVPIDKLVVRESNQNEATIDKYVNWYKKTKKILPLIGVENWLEYSGKVVISDGHHRYFAARKLGLKTIPVWVSLTDKKNPIKPVYAKDLKKKWKILDGVDILEVKKISRTGLYQHTKGLFRDMQGNLYKSMEKYRTDNALTKEYEVLKHIQDIPEIVRIGEKVLTSEGMAFEIEELRPFTKEDKISLQEFNQFIEIAKKLDDRDISLYESPDLGVDKNNKIKLYDFSTSEFKKVKDNLDKSVSIIGNFLLQYLNKEDYEYLNEKWEKEMQEKINRYTNGIKNQKTTKLIGYRNKYSKEKGINGTFYYLKKIDKDLNKKIIYFNNLLVIPHREVEPFYNLPSTYLFNKWFKGYDIDKELLRRGWNRDDVAYDYESILIDDLVTNEAIMRGYDGIKFGNEEFVDLKDKKSYQEITR